MGKPGREHELTLFKQMHNHDSWEDWQAWFLEPVDENKPPEACRTYLMDPDSRKLKVRTSGGS